MYTKENSLSPFYVQVEQIVLLPAMVVIISLALNYSKKGNSSRSPRSSRSVVLPRSSRIFPALIFLSENAGICR
jgi:hypothetical protein